jgi:hypothetical protein
VLEVIETVKRVSGVDFEVAIVRHALAWERKLLTRAD